MYRSWGVVAVVGVLTITAGCHPSSDSSASASASASTQRKADDHGNDKGEAKGSASSDPAEADEDNDDNESDDDGDDGPSPDGASWALDDAGLQKKVEQIVTKASEDLHVPGISITVIRDKHAVVQKGYGLADVDAKTPETKETLGAVGSETKIVTAVAILQLAEQKKLALSDPFTKYVKDCPAIWNPITIRQLLSMQSGIPHTKIPHDWKEAIAWAAARPLSFPPGTKTDYSNTNFNLLGEVVETASGMSYADYLNAHVFSSLKMTSTRLRAPTDPPGMAVGYAWAKKKRALDHAQPWTGTGYGAGGLISNQLDMALFDGGLSGDALLAKASSDEMYTVQPLDDGKKGARGLAWDTVHVIKGKRRVTKAGDVPGYKAFYARAVDEGVSVILLGNADVKKLNGIGRSIFVEALQRK